MNKASLTQIHTPGSDALRLLSAALDPEGWICIARAWTDKATANEFFAPGQYQEAVEFAAKWSAKGMNLYFCTATLRTRDNRKQTNFRNTKVLKIDFDIHPDGIDPKTGQKKYRSKKEALLALNDFIVKLGLPTPTVVISGGGLHVYWFLNRYLELEEARLVLDKFKDVLNGHGLLIDQAVPDNPVGILRIPGTFNYKIPGKPRAVRLADPNDPMFPVDADDVIGIIKGEYDKLPREATGNKTYTASAFGYIPAHVRSEGLDEATLNMIGAKPKSFDIILDKSHRKDKDGNCKGCMQIYRLATQQSQIPEPEWRAGLSIAYNCTDGLEAIHKISSAHPEYDFDDTVKKAEALSGMPFRCETFNRDIPNICPSCKHWGQITSPIQLGEFIEEAPASATSDRDAALIARLAALPKLQYDRVRAKEAKALNVRTSTLDELVETARGEKAEADDALFMEVKPWPEPVDPADLLQQITALVKRFVVCEQQTAIAAALWITLSWFADYVEVLPLANITAPQKRCGKSTLLFLMSRLVRKPLPASNISPAALFRSIDKWSPTILLDEADAFLKENEELRGLINSGHTRGSAYVVRVVGEDFRPERFSTWGPKVLCGIGKLADTLEDRSISLELRRRLQNETVDKLRQSTCADQFEVLTRQLARFAQDYGEQVRDARPSMPDDLNDRACDNWESMLAIADIAGGEWPELAMAAALQISGGTESVASIEVELLQDIQQIFAGQSEKRIFSKQLLLTLGADEDRPWAGYNRGAPIRARQLASKLKQFGIEPQPIRIGDHQARGYELQQFADAFRRYLGPVAENSEPAT